MPPEPRPYLIDLGDYFIVDPARTNEAVRLATNRLLAMTPTERLCWNACWCQHVRELERAGKDVGKEVYGVAGLKQASAAPSETEEVQPDFFVTF